MVSECSYCSVYLSDAKISAQLRWQNIHILLSLLANVQLFGTAIDLFFSIFPIIKTFWWCFVKSNFSGLFVLVLQQDPKRTHFAHFFARINLSLTCLPF